MTKDNLETLTAILADANKARKQADDALASLRFRLREFGEELAKLKPTDTPT